MDLEGFEQNTLLSKIILNAIISVKKTLQNHKRLHSGDFLLNNIMELYVASKMLCIFLLLDFVEFAGKGVQCINQIKLRIMKIGIPPKV